MCGVWCVCVVCWFVFVWRMSCVVSCLLFAVCCLLFVVGSLFVGCCLLAVCCLLCDEWRSLFVVCVFVCLRVRCLLFGVCCLLLVCCLLCVVFVVC